MKKWNEKGYSLIIVLFVIIIFSIVGISLFTMTLSNTKQIAQVEKQMVAVDLAEMGATYYETSFSDYSYDILLPKIKDAIDEIEAENAAIEAANAENAEKDPNSESQPLIEITVGAILNRLDTANISMLPPVALNTPILDGDNNFKILEHTNQGYDASSKKFIITFKSNGYTADGEQATLNGTVEVDMDQFITKYLNGETPLLKPSVPELDSITASCTGDFNISSANNCIYTGDVSPPNSTKDISTNGKINGSFTVGSNVDWTNTKLYIKDDFIIGNNQTMNNVTIISNGKADIDNTSISNATMYFDKGGVIGNLTVAENKYLNLYSNKDLTLGVLTGGSGLDNSTIMVNGTLTTRNINSPITNTCVICALKLSGGIVDYQNANPTLNIYSYETNPEQFTSTGACFDLTSGVDPNDLLNQMNIEYD